MSGDALSHIGPGRVVALCGGVGGAKLALGLYRLLGEDLSVVVNTGDDFEHLGLAISPDVDTVLYTLSERADKERGWGREAESWNFLGALSELGGETWFQLGDKDLALHVLRSAALARGESLSDIVASFAQHFGIKAKILPMSDDPIRTVVETPEGNLPFQRYFVEGRCEEEVIGVRFDGVDTACVSKPVIAALKAPDLRAIVICPSNPFLSIDPILATPGMQHLIRSAKAPVVAVSPLIGGAAVKGPTAKIMTELKVPATVQAIAVHYRGLIDGLVIDQADAAQREDLELPCSVSHTLMTTEEDRVRLAGEVLDFANKLALEAEAAPPRGAAS
ncbi:2-phospho-L-lactate transferase [Methyloligella sp. 2.7D]|uniref:2-phospho-L-lactate transferase n=1 Tax=unclassified Methyloligella TaxID=2625955 RepID=UPI00157CDCDE|nr:2-phospho-L-lactate transferase [Methyloligella sp. GL2]QKP78216.1 2-phospho-L-lactate transferase [Methyloligella sp. GL2]